MAYTKIINKTYDLADELKQSFYYQEMIRLDQIIKTKYKKELQSYKENFSKFDEVYSQGGKYHPDFKKVSKDYADAKKELFSKLEVKQYFEYETKINDLLEKISNEICGSISKHYNKGGTCSWL